MPHAGFHCDQERALAYLESANPPNLSLYVRQGFEPMGKSRSVGVHLSHLCFGGRVKERLRRVTDEHYVPCTIAFRAQRVNLRRRVWDSIVRGPLELSQFGCAEDPISSQKSPSV
jgi:hypothetical protein